jgi:DNA mismatch repair protein MutS2
MDPKSLEAADLIAYLHRTRDELDRMQSQMTGERHALEAERKKLQTEWLGRQQKRIAELEAQFAEMQKRFEQNVASVVEAVKDRELRAQLEKSSRRKLQDVRGTAKEDLNTAIVQTISESQADLGVTSAELQPVAAEKLQPGAKIRVKGFAKPLIFRRLDGNSAEVEAGPLRMKVALDEITAIEGVPQMGSAVGFRFSGTSSGVSLKSAPRESAASEINVIGMTVEQATELVDKFLDDAALAHLPQVRIIHGHGTGALRKGLGEYLKTQPLVAKASFESEEHGGKAITVVELRS